MSKRHAFTLVEILIVIVIIGILAAALIPRLTGIQARARDTARLADMRNVSTALESYKLDNNTYPIAVYASTSSPRRLTDIVIPKTFAQTVSSSLNDISPLISSYLTSLPQDPNGSGIKSSNAGECITAGNSYAYYTDPSGSLYSITSIKESQKGNASACGDTIDRNNDGAFQKIGEGLIYNVQGENSGNTQSTNISITINRFGSIRQNIELYIGENQSTPYTILNLEQGVPITITISSNTDNIYFKMDQNINFIDGHYTVSDEDSTITENIPGASYSSSYGGSYQLNNISLDGSKGTHINFLVFGG